MSIEREIGKGLSFIDDTVRDIARETLEKCNSGKNADWTTMKNSLKNNIAHYIYETTKRSPMILPIIMEV